MPVALIVGPLAALVGIVAIFFVFRRKSVDKRSMYSARRSQIEHKVRAARQRTLIPQGRAEKPPDVPPEIAPTSIFAPSATPPRVTYEPSAYKPPPAAAPPAKEESAASAWDSPPNATPPQPAAPSQYAAPEAPPAPVEEWTPAPAPAEPPRPAEPVLTPAPPAPVEPEPERAAPVEPKHPSVAAAAPGSWSVVAEGAKESAETSADQPRKKGKHDTSSASWQLASGDAPGAEEPGDMIKTPSAAVAIAQYAVLVVGLIMVLIGVFVMIANSHVT